MCRNYKQYVIIEVRNVNDMLLFINCNQNLVVCNAGLSTGLQQEVLLDEFSRFGAVLEVVMLRDKSYCFVKCGSESCAIAIYDSVHGRSRLSQNGGVIYLSYSTAGTTNRTVLCPVCPIQNIKRN